MDGFGIPVASQARVVWTFTVTVTLVGPKAIDGGTKTIRGKHTQQIANYLKYV